MARSVKSVMLKCLVGALLVPTVSHADLIGHWTFNDGQELNDLTGNFANLILSGDASVSGGALDVNGVGTVSTGRSLSGPGYIGPNIVDKTLVSWVTLQSLSDVAFAGSALTIDRVSGDHFDGIVFAERQANEWMSGSSFFNRTQDFSPGFVETSVGDFIQLAFVYDDLDNVAGGAMSITGYRNGVLLGTYLTGNGSSWNTGDAEVFFGSRHRDWLAPS